MPFATPYQRWYSEVKVLIKQLLPDRLVDFVQHYEKPKSRTSEYLPIRDLSVSINPRRKACRKPFSRPLATESRPTIPGYEKTER